MHHRHREKDRRKCLKQIIEHVEGLIRLTPASWMLANVERYDDDERVTLAAALLRDFDRIIYRGSR